MDYTQLFKTIGREIPNTDLITNVFVHRSYLNENKSFHLKSNEKLEFLGDSVLSLITSIYLYRNYKSLEEGDYTDIKASIVRMESLYEAATTIELGKYLLLSKGEEVNNGRTNTNILADCFEALIAAIFLTHNFESAYDFVVKFLFGDKLDYIIKNKLYLSPKSLLQEIVQEKFKVLPTYTVTQEEGPEHSKIFTVTCEVAGRVKVVGTGKSKKQAEESAAKIALDKINDK